MKLDKIVNSKYEKVVSAEPLENGEAALFIRNGDKVSKETAPYQPFMLLKNPALLQGLDEKFDLESLSGEAQFGYLAIFPDLDVYDKAIKFLKQNTGFNPSSPNAPFKLVSDRTQQLLMLGQFRLFRGMSFNEMRRMQFDIETRTTEGFEFPNPARKDDQIIIISMSDNTGWEKLISLDKMDEKELLQEFVKTVEERDPDVLEGHNIFRFDLPYIEARAKMHKVKLNIGREGKVLKKRNSRFTAAERTINYTRYDVYGRHVIDTYHLVQLYDISHRDLDGYGLKDVAKHFGVAPENRVYVEGKEISNIWESDRSKLLDYALDDARETLAISNILSPSYFYQAQLIPMKYQDCVVRGNATRIDSMLVAAYLERKASVPMMEQGRPFSGALTKAFHSGVFENVWHCDVRSLYPSIILSEKWIPSRDTEKVFPELLSNLRTFRLEAKDNEKKAKNSEEKDYFNSLQTTFKILINSFYGYLGFSQGAFNDYEMAEKVTTRGREILTSMLDFLNENGANVIEMDTDGIYFQPPPGADDTEKMENLIQEVLPQGIDVELDSTYPAMFCYKSKNYALLSENGEVAITGAALKSRGLEPFQRDYIKEIISMLLHKKTDEIKTLTDDFRNKIENRLFPLDKLAKTEILNDSVDSYRKKLAGGKGRRSASYELAGASTRDYQRGDQVSFYVTGDKKNVSVVDNSQLLSDASEERNENVKYYLGKLDELVKKFAEFTKEPEQDSNSLGLEF
jgi:DNA polymerase elongation subunit (family B)